MNWLQRFWNRVTRDPRPEEVRIFFNGRTQAGEFISGDTALQNATVWACVTYLGRTVGQLPWRVMWENADGVCERVPTHPVDRLLSRRPCPEIPPLAWREMMTGWAALHGNAVAEIVTDQRGLAAGLYPIHPSRVTFKRDYKTNELLYQVSNETAEVTLLRADQVFHIRGFGDGPVGLDVISYAAESIGWARAAEMFGASFFGEGMNPAGVVTVPGKLTQNGFTTLRASLESIYKGPKKGNRTAILDAGMTWTAISRSAEESQFIETRQHQIAEMCRWFGVPPHKVMDLLRGTFSNIEHQSIEVVVDSITPWALRFEQEADYKLFGPANKQGYYTKMDMKGLLRGDFKSRAEGLMIMRNAGVVSADEWRALEDMNPLPAGAGGDKYMVPLNMTTLERLGEEPAAPASTDLQNSANVQAVATAIVRNAEIVARAMQPRETT